MTTSGLPERRQAEFMHARDSLSAEWRYWIDESVLRRDGREPALEKHQTQIARVVRTLRAGLDALGQDPGPQGLERILDLHHVWDFFRVKFALRYLEPLKGFLGAADELAWTVYRPAVEQAERSGAALREPPLVFLDRGAVPFASARGNSYRDLLPRDVRTRTGAEAASVLPFPVIGVPWYLIGHLPGVLLVAHEVGHQIEDDLALTAPLSQRLAAALPAPRLKVWRSWLGEAFADMVASVACGVAYPTVLLDALAGMPPGGARAESYPPPRVRILICLAAVSQAGLPGDPGLAAHCDRLGQPDDADEDATKVAAAILTGPYRELGGQELRTVLKSSAVAAAGEGAGRLLAGLSSNLTDVRAVLAAAALAFARSPEGYDKRRVGQAALDEVLRLRPAGMRHGEVAAAREAQDVEAGRTLLGLFDG